MQSPRRLPERWRRVAARVDIAALVVLAYVPSLLSSPGRMPADSKLYLYEGPGALLSDARWSYDTHQFGGWVTHQIVSYLWPAGPWFWTLEHVGVPDWVAHRLWIGTLFVAAGLGMRWLARALGLPPAAAFAGAVFYQCSPYVLPYVSRTSMMLLPWAGLPWLVGLTRRAVREPGWWAPAWFGLVLITVGGVNLTATAMIAPGPILWLVHEWRSPGVRLRTVATALARLGAVTVGACTWWLAAVAVQGKWGADVLTYSETYASVTYTSSAAEVARGMGYWLAYVDNPVPATTMARPYQHSPVLVALGFLLVAAGALGLAVTRWAPRRFAAWTAAAGILLAAAGFDDDARIGRFLANHSTNTLVLGLRSSTRATPLVLLGFGLGFAALTTVAAAHAPPVRRVAVAAIASLLVVTNMPALWTAGLVDPQNDRAGDVPAAWHDVADALDRLDQPGSAAGILQLPGAEFGAHNWGVTVDPLLPGLTRRPLLTRDLLPLGSPALMDVLYALDDTVQAGVFEPASLAPIARLLGAGTIVVPLDWDAARYGTYPPASFAASLAGVPGLRAEPNAGAGVAGAWSVDPTPAATRASTDMVVVVGDGTGIVHAAAAALITGDEAIVPAASIPAGALPAELTAARAMILTDSNRKRARHWRTSQEPVGATEPADGPAPGDHPSPDDDGDHRLPVFPGAGPDTQTVAVYSGDVLVDSSSYGGPNAYRPEDRPFHAIDGDPASAWRTGRGSSPLTQRIDLTLAPGHTVSRVRVRQAESDRRWITSVTVNTDHRRFDVELGPESRAAGQIIDLGEATSRIGLAIVSTGGPDSAEPFDGTEPGVGFADVAPLEDDRELTGTETIRLPTMLDGVGTAIAPTTPLAVVLSRERADRPDRDRRDPERRIVREFSLPQSRSLALTATVAPSSAPPPVGCRSDVIVVDGTPRPVTVDTGTMTAHPCDGRALSLTAGSHRVEVIGDALTIDRIVLADGPWPVPGSAPIDVRVMAHERTHRSAMVGPCPQGCWFVLGDGLNDGWEASVDGRDLGPPRMVGAGMTGWWLPPHEQPVTVDARWPPQRTTNIGLGITAVTALACAGLAIVTGRRRRNVPSPDPGPEFCSPYGTSGRGRIGPALFGAAVAALFTSPVNGLVVGVLVLAAPAIGALAGAVAFVGVGVAYVYELVSERPPPGFDWVATFRDSHRPVVTAVILLAAGITAVEAARRRNRQV
jgi:arabinofuranan 3-O-arabinosyltransferase